MLLILLVFGLLGFGHILIFCVDSTHQDQPSARAADLASLYKRISVPVILIRGTTLGVLFMFTIMVPKPTSAK